MFRLNPLPRQDLWQWLDLTCTKGRINGNVCFKTVAKATFKAMSSQKFWQYYVWTSCKGKKLLPWLNWTCYSAKIFVSLSSVPVTKGKFFGSVLSERVSKAKFVAVFGWACCKGKICGNIWMNLFQRQNLWQYLDEPVAKAKFVAIFGWACCKGKNCGNIWVSLLQGQFVAMFGLTLF